MHVYNAIDGKEYYPREIYYSQAERIEALEEYIMDEAYDPWRDMWCGINELKRLGITDEQMRLFRTKKLYEREHSPF